MLNSIKPKLEKLWFRNPQFLSSRYCFWSAHFKPTVHENPIKKHCIFCLNNLSVVLQMSFFYCHAPSFFPRYHYFSGAKNHNNIMTFVSFHRASFLVEKKLILSMSCKKTLSVTTIVDTHRQKKKKKKNSTNKTSIIHFSRGTKTFLFSI